MLRKDRWSSLERSFGAPQTGISVVLRDLSGNPIGLPVQLSKNWHGRSHVPYENFYFHGPTHFGIVGHGTIDIEISLVYDHWGGYDAVSHSQLSLIGFGFNQLWDEAAFGSRGENMCFEMDQVTSSNSITDVRPLDVYSYDDNNSTVWTNNVGGGDFFRYFDTSGTRRFPSAMKNAYLKQGPCLTEVIYAGVTANLFTHSATVSLARSNDLNRVTFKLRLDVTSQMSFSRFVIFQIGADSYSKTKNDLFAYGNLSGLIKEWNTNVGTGAYNQKFELTGTTPWISLHGVHPEASTKGSWANRGIIIRNWNAKVGDVAVRPWIGEHGYIHNFTWEGTKFSESVVTADIILPPTINTLMPGDFVEVTLETVVIPRYYSDYLGPNTDLKNALKVGENSWKMVQREAEKNNRVVTVKTGTLVSLYPTILIESVSNRAEFTLSNGLGLVAISISNLDFYSGYSLYVNGVLLNQSVFGNDFWQTDYNPLSLKYTQTFNIPILEGKSSLNIVLSSLD